MPLDERRQGERGQNFVDKLNFQSRWERGRPRPRLQPQHGAITEGWTTRTRALQAEMNKANSRSCARTANFWLEQVQARSFGDIGNG